MVDGAGNHQDQTCSMNHCGVSQLSKSPPLMLVFIAKKLWRPQNHFLRPCLSSWQRQSPSAYPIQCPFDWRISRALKPSIISRLSGNPRPDSASALLLSHLPIFVLATSLNISVVLTRTGLFLPSPTLLIPIRRDMLCSLCLPSSCVRRSIVASNGDSHVMHLPSSLTLRHSERAPRCTRDPRNGLTVSLPWKRRYSYLIQKGKNS